MNTAAHLTKETTMTKCRHHSCTKPAVNTLDHGWCVLELCQKHTQIMARIIISNKFNLTVTPLND